MKICLLNVLHEPLDKRVFQKVARSLVGAGHEVVSVCPGEAPSPSDAHGVRFRTIPMAATKKHRLLSMLRLIRAGRAERADVYMAPEPESWVAALVVKLTSGGKVVLDMHEHVPTEFAKFFPRLLRPLVVWLTARFMRLFARYTDHIILTRESFEAPWRGLKVPRTTVINTNRIQPACEDAPEELAARYAGKPTVIHQGLFGVERGSYQLLEAMKILKEAIPEIQCIVLGAYVYGDENEYRAAIREAGLEENMHLLGVVPFDAVPAYIAVSRVGLILFQPGPLNHTLAMPHKLFDYMRERRPVVAPGFAIEVARIVDEADCGRLADVAEPEAIAAAIRELLEDPEEARRLGENGRGLVETKYNWQNDEAKLLAVFESLERG